jgi:FAD/FMN-containing dehydrogenase
MTALAPKTIPSQAECLTAVGLQSQTLVPGDADYDARQDSYWSNSAKIRPAAIVRPRSAEEVSVALKAVVGAKQPFAVRSGGHTNWAGSNNIEGGVTIDLSLLNTVVYDAASETASIGPGCRWREVYAELHKHGRVVAGGREGNVGVAGLLLGGGNTFFTARRGFACDNVVAYQIVLADGRIIDVDKDSHPDLFRALKGGSNNFGIVTKFTMTAIPCDKVWGGMAFLPKQVIPAAIEAVSSFTDNVANDPDSNLVAMFTHMPDFKDIVVATLYANVAGIEKPPAYEKWLAFPEILTTVKMTSVSEMAFEYNIPAQLQ